MSFHLHLRAVPAQEIAEDFDALSRFMLASWEVHAEEYQAGIADSICKDFDAVDKLYTRTGEPASTDGATADPARGLPIYGGLLVQDETGNDPPFVILDPAAVQSAAQFLRTVSFDERWKVVGAELSKPYAGWDDPLAAKKIFFDYHRDLRAFYERTAGAGKAVVKAFWY